MNILKQFYNDAGQIVSRTPDLTTREFYRDVMCRHKFNEMFVAAKERSGPTQSSVPGFVFYDYAGGSGEAIGVADSQAGIALVPGRDGRKAVVSQATEPGDLSVLFDYNAGSFGILGDVSYGIIFRSPSDQSDWVYSPSLSVTFTYINSLDDNLIYETVSSAPVSRISCSFYKLRHTQYWQDPEKIHVVCIPSDSNINWPEIELAEGSSILSDGGWHLLEAEIHANGSTVFKVDGAVAGAVQMDASVVRFYRPNISCTLWGAANIENKYAIDSAWIKTL